MCVNMMKRGGDASARRRRSWSYKSHARARERGEIVVQDVFCSKRS